MRGREAEKKNPEIRTESAAAELERRLRADASLRPRILQARMLAAKLGERDSQQRAEAREKLLAIGRPALPALLVALKDSDSAVRWQAAKALSQMHDPETAVDLMNAMEDEDFGVRWLAAEGLIAMGPSSLEALLLGLMQRFNSVRLREGAHHVLHVLIDNGLHDEAYERLLHSLEGVEPAAEVAWAAEKAWEELTGRKPPERGAPEAHKQA
jgi:HEAT repeat protein